MKFILQFYILPETQNVFNGAPRNQIEPFWKAAQEARGSVLYVTYTDISEHWDGQGARETWPELTISLFLLSFHFQILQRNGGVRLTTTVQYEPTGSISVFRTQHVDRCSRGITQNTEQRYIYFDGF